MKIKLVNIKFNEQLSDDTNCFSADVKSGSKKIGTTGNRGRGGPTDTRFDPNLIKADDEKSICDWCIQELKDTPDYRGEVKQEKYLEGKFKIWVDEWAAGKYPLGAIEYWVDLQIEAHIKNKEAKKLEKDVAKKISFRVKDGPYANYQSYKNIPYSEAAALKVRGWIEEEYKKDEYILLTPELVKKIGVEATIGSFEDVFKIALNLKK